MDRSDDKIAHVNLYDWCVFNDFTIYLHISFAFVRIALHIGIVNGITRPATDNCRVGNETSHYALNYFIISIWSSISGEQDTKREQKHDFDFEYH